MLDIQRRLLVALALAVGAPAVLAQEEAYREARAEAILAREEQRGRPFDPAFRAARKALLMAATDDQLAGVEQRGRGLLPEASVLGEAPHNLVLTPITPCRIIDTRLAGGPLAAGTPRDFRVAGSTGFDTQGGEPTGCGVPLGRAKAVVVNFVAVNPAGPGNLRAWPFTEPPPSASVINYAAVGLNIANGLVMPICPVDSTTCTSDLTVRADVSATQLVADVLGYFISERRSSVATAAAASGGTPVPIACANIGGVSVAVGATGLGSIVLRGTASIEMIHFNGQDDEVKAFIGTTPTDCASTTPSTSRVPAALPSFAAPPGMWVELNPVRLVTVLTPGFYTYYLNFQNTGAGVGNDRFRLGHLEATYHPYN